MAALAEDACGFSWTMLDQETISRGLKLRVAAFVLAIAGMVALIAWTAQNAWRRSGELRERLTSVQLQSFQIADHFQKSILELNNLVLRYGVYRNPDDWARFQTESRELDQWIDNERPILSTEGEKEVLDLINTNYDYYLTAAREINARLQSRERGATPLAEFAAFEKQSQSILSLGFHLAGAHHESMTAFLDESKRALSYLRILLVSSLALLMLAGGGLAVVIYGELIAPLRVRLVENQVLMDRQEKLASLGMLAAGVAHEIRNPLTAIKAWLFIQQKHLKPDTPESADAQIISNEISRLERIVKDVLLLARPTEPHFEILTAETPLIQVQTLLSPQLEKSGIKLQHDESVNAKIRIDPAQIQQVLINLIQNAAESIGQNGTITLRSRAGTKYLLERYTDVVILEIADTGKGISAEVEKRLFDPFFTTKESGTGLGLSIASRIVEKHGGAIQYQTVLHRGTTFGIVLPRV